MESFIHSLTNGEINLATGLVWLAVAGIFAGGSGALSAMKLGGQDIGNELAGMMGTVFGPIGAIPAVLLGLVILKLIH
jgi:hypothetical protein